MTQPGALIREQFERAADLERCAGTDDDARRWAGIHQRVAEAAVSSKLRRLG